MGGADPVIKDAAHLSRSGSPAETFHGLFSSLSCWLANGAFGFSFDFARTQSLFDSLTKLGTELESVGGFGNGRQGGRCLTFR